MIDLKLRLTENDLGTFQVFKLTNAFGYGEIFNSTEVFRYSIQIFVKAFFTPLGSNLLDKEYGSGFFNYLRVLSADSSVAESALKSIVKDSLTLSQKLFSNLKVTDYKKLLKNVTLVRFQLVDKRPIFSLRIENYYGETVDLEY